MQLKSQQIRNQYTIEYNLINAKDTFDCSSAVTLFHSADIDFVKNIPELAKNWAAPISLAIYLSQDQENNFLLQMRQILHCDQQQRGNDSLTVVEKFVDFHIYYLSEWKPNVGFWKNFILHRGQVQEEESCGAHSRRSGNFALKLFLTFRGKYAFSFND